jgi:hypothetical protein
MVDLLTVESAGSSTLGVSDSPNGVDEFDAILEESEQESVRGMSLLEELSRENALVGGASSADSVESVESAACPGPRGRWVDSEGVEWEDITQSYGTGVLKQRVGSRLAKVRKRDNREVRGKWLGQKSQLDMKACDMESVRLLMGYVEYKPHWAVDACVVMREQGVCAVCKEPVGRGYVVRMVVPRARGGEYVEDNCVCVCKHCGECWFMHKDFNVGWGRQDMLDRLCVAVMERRRRRFHGVKDLNDMGVERLKELSRVTEDRRVRELKFAKATKEGLVKVYGKGSEEV